MNDFILKRDPANRLTADCKVVDEVIRRTLILRGYSVEQRPFVICESEEDVYSVRFAFVIGRRE